MKINVEKPVYSSNSGKGILCSGNKVCFLIQVLCQKWKCAYQPAHTPNKIRFSRGPHFESIYISEEELS